MKNFDYTVESKKGFQQAVADVEAKSQEKGFRVLHTHDLQATLKEKGFPREPLKIVEVCNAQYASQMLGQDIKIALSMPCPIAVYTENGKTYISTMRAKALTEIYPEADIRKLSEEVDLIVKSIIDEAK